MNLTVVSLTLLPVLCCLYCVLTCYYRLPCHSFDIVACFQPVYGSVHHTCVLVEL